VLKGVFDFADGSEKICLICPFFDIEKVGDQAD
jgi:hypothetical protein